MPRQTRDYAPIRGVDWDDIIHAQASGFFSSWPREGSTTLVQGRCVKLSKEPRGVPWHGQIQIEVEGSDVATDEYIIAHYPRNKVFKKLYPVYTTFEVDPELRDPITGEYLEEFPMKRYGDRWKHVEPRTRDLDMIRRGTCRANPAYQKFVLRVVAFKVDQENQVEIIGGWVE